MLGKLLKHEFAATGRTFIPLYLGIILVASMVRITGMIKGDGFSIVSVLFMIAYIMMIFVIMIVTLIVMINRFRKNLLGDEGYLSFTLPVTPAQLIITKSIAASVWIIIGTIVGIASFCILAINSDSIEWINAIWKEIKPIFEIEGSHTYLILLGIAYLIEILAQPLIFYCAMAIGQLFNSHRGILSFVAYLAIYTVYSTISTLFGVLIVGTNNMTVDETQLTADATADLMNTMSTSMLGVIIIYTVVGATCFMLTKKILTDKLNLE